MNATQDGWELPITENQLARLTDDMTEAHHETLPAMQASAAELAEEIRTRSDGVQGPGRPATDRRRFLLGAGGGAAAFLLAACSGGGGDTSAAALDADSSASPSPSGSSSGSTYTGDLQLVALSVALENQAVGAYRATLKAAKAGKLGKVPPAVATFVTTAMSQHADHAKAWNAVLTGAGKPAIHDVPLSDQNQLMAALGKATSVGAAAKLALRLEDQAAQTYLYATAHVKSVAGVSTAATIAPVEAMHAAILHFVLGQYPVPDAFLPVNSAAKPSLLTV
ncbi:ferritin-like domain-containing protein [Streptomyces sp. NPDC094437]|uniref:ferritin-like domain-containing protein n=1 Tax=Streptomyces sp. NPDC094437 TaxID=3366060 RepID=UPI00382AB2CE